VTATLLVGCGNMGRALLDGWLAAGVLSPAEVTVADPLAQVPEGVTRVDAIPGGGFDLVVLAIKPQQLEELGGTLGEHRGILLSIIAGVPLTRLRAIAPAARPARIMANLAAAFGQSPVALYAEAPTSADRALLDKLGAALGPVEWLDDEALLHVVTALGGSGPGFVYRLLEALARGGEGLGLDQQASRAMSLAMVRGAVELAARSGEEFAALTARVASPGGTTSAGLDVLEADDALDRLVAATLRAARDRSLELGS
jgi:pyrroline-5-carboxylate reductase